jgi:hypothetical protein
VEDAVHARVDGCILALKKGVSLDGGGEARLAFNTCNLSLQVERVPFLMSRVARTPNCPWTGMPASCYFLGHEVVNPGPLGSFTRLAARYRCLD